jgi:hypothetical protein
MKLRTLMITAALIASATGTAFAQTGNGDSAAYKQDMKKDAMTQNSPNKDKMMKPSESTTGSGMNSPSKNVEVSPASPDSGAKPNR